MGSVFRVPFRCGEDPADILAWLDAKGIHTYGAHLDGTCRYSEPSYREGCAFFIGNEGNGLSPALTAACGTLIRIPMEGRLESLNAAVAAAILMYTVHEKRFYQP
jgi:TrmH family RNA methyltransferase